MEIKVLYNATGHKQLPGIWGKYDLTMLETIPFVPFEDFDRIKSSSIKLAALIPENSNVLLGRKQLFNDYFSLLLLAKGCRLFFLADKHKNVLPEPDPSSHGIELVETQLSIFYRSRELGTESCQLQLLKS